MASSVTWGSAKQKATNSTVKNSKSPSAATTDDISEKTLTRDLATLKKSFRDLAAKLKPEKEAKSDFKPAIEEPVKKEENFNPSEWLFGNKDSKELTGDHKLTTVQELDETASTSSTDVPVSRITA